MLSRLRDARKPDGTTENIGHILTGWVSVSPSHKIGFEAGRESSWRCACVPAAALSLLLHAVLQQPGAGQGPAGPEEAGPAGPGLLAALPAVSVQQEVGPVELPGHPSQPAGEVPAAAQRDPEAHAQRPPGPAAPGGGGEETQP